MSEAYFPCLEKKLIEGYFYYKLANSNNKIYKFYVMYETILFQFDKRTDAEETRKG